MLYSLNGAYPAPLPSLLLYNNEAYSDDARFDVLASVGYTGPYTVPEYNAATHNLAWTGSEFVVTAKTQAELDALELSAAQTELAATDAQFKPRWIEDIEAGTPHQAYLDWKANRETLRATIRRLTPQV